MKTPLNLVRSSAEALEAQRSCGTCTACCVLPRIAPEEFFPKGKQGYTPCENLCAAGCSVYEQRPPTCSGYTCLWRAGILVGDERRRPDQLGLMFTVEDLVSGLAVEAWELWDGAASDHPGRGVIDAVAKRYKVMIRFYGVPCSINYDSPICFDLGRRLCLASKEDPEALVVWCEHNIRNGWLQSKPEQVEVVQQDLEAMRRGEPVQRYFRRVS